MMATTTRKFLRPLFLLAVLFLLAAINADAQFISDPISLNAVPSAPSPGQTFRALADTPTFDKNSSLFEWRIDGVARPNLSGFGKNSFNLEAPKQVGDSVQISVTVTRLDGKEFNANLSVPVADLSLTWFSQTYVPNWYKGKALAVQDSQIEVVAIPQLVINRVAMPPENLIYQWQLDEQESEERALGKQAFRFTASAFPGIVHRVKMTVEDANRTVKKEKEIFIRLSRPKIAMYHSSPLGGGETRSSAAIFKSFSRGILDFVVEPFFFTVANRKNLSYQWRVDRSPVIGSPQNPDILTIDTSSTRLLKEFIPITVDVDDTNILIPAVSSSFTLQFQSP